MSPEAPASPANPSPGSLSAANATGVEVMVGGNKPGGDAPARVVIQNQGKTAEAMRHSWETDRAIRGAAAIAELAAAAAPAVVEADAAAEVPAPDPTADPAAALQRAVLDGMDAPAATAPAQVTEAQPVTEMPAKEVTATGGDDRLARIEKAGAAAKAGAARYRAQQEALATARAEAAQHRARAEQAEQRAARGLSLEEAWRKDPLTAIREAGITPDQLVQKALKEGTPEAKIEALAAQNRALEDRLNQSEQTRKQAEAIARQEAEETRLQADLVRLAGNAARYPNLQDLTPEAIVERAIGIAVKARTRYAKQGINWEYDQRAVLQYMNENPVAKKVAPAAEPPKVAAAAAPPKVAATPGPSKSKTPATPRTTTTGNSPGTISRPANFAALSRAERIAIVSRAH